MKIHVLVDNHARRKFAAEWGLSVFIENRDKKILFDYGHSDLFLRNAEKMGLNILDADFFVLSHGHWDHGNGLRYLPSRQPQIKMICHPGCFIERFRGNSYLGLSSTFSELNEKFEFDLHKEPYEFTEDVFFLGEVKRKTDFENKVTNFVKKDGTMDLVADDSGIVVKTSEGLVILTGCGHAGVCNTIEHAIDITGDERIFALMGGFHLKGNDEITFRTVKELSKYGVKHLYPTHCTEYEALVEFTSVFHSKPLNCGLTLDFPD